MADPPAYRDTGDDTGVEPDRRATAGTPRWVKVFGLIALVVVLLFLALLLTRGPHNPGRHRSGEHTPPLAITQHGAQQP
jgi:hypothetical protein